MKRTPLVRRTPLTGIAGLRRTARPRSDSNGPRPRRNPLPPDVRRLVIERDRGRCRRCGGPGGSIHHRLPRGMGGTRWAGIHSPELLVLLCGDGTTGCHGWIESNRAEALRLGWLLSRHLFGIDPEQVPLRWADRPERLYLHHDGATSNDLPTSRTELAP